MILGKINISIKNITMKSTLQTWCRDYSTYWASFIILFFNMLFYKNMQIYCVFIPSLLAMIHCVLNIKKGFVTFMTISFIIYTIADIVFLLSNYVYAPLVYVYVPVYLIGHICSIIGIIYKQLKVNINPITHDWQTKVLLIIPYLSVYVFVVVQIFRLCDTTIFNKIGFAIYNFVEYFLCWSYATTIIPNDNEDSTTNNKIKEVIASFGYIFFTIADTFVILGLYAFNLGVYINLYNVAVMIVYCTGITLVSVICSQ